MLVEEAAQAEGSSRGPGDRLAANLRVRAVEIAIEAWRRDKGSEEVGRFLGGIVPRVEPGEIPASYRAELEEITGAGRAPPRC